MCWARNSEFSSGIFFASHFLWPLYYFPCFILLTYFSEWSCLKTQFSSVVLKWVVRWIFISVIWVVCRLNKAGFYSVLSSNDKNLCSKALLSGVNALSKNDLEAEAERSRRGLHDLRNIQTPTPPRVSPQVSSPQPLPRRSCASVQPPSQRKACLSAALTEKGEPGINAFFMQNRKQLGMLRHRADVNSTYHLRAHCVHPTLPIFLFFIPSLQTAPCLNNKNTSNKQHMTQLKANGMRETLS